MRRIGAAAIVGCASWAFWPAAAGEPVVAQDALTTAEAPREESPDEAAIDLDAYEVALWNPPPAPDQVPAPTLARAPQRPKLELVAIIDEAGTLRAAFYDEESDDTVIVGVGETVGTYTVTAIEPQYVEISNGRATVRFDRTEQSP